MNFMWIKCKIKMSIDFVQLVFSRFGCFFLKELLKSVITSLEVLKYETLNENRTYRE